MNPRLSKPKTSQALQPLSTATTSCGLQLEIQPPPQATQNWYLDRFHLLQKCDDICSRVLLLAWDHVCELLGANGGQVSKLQSETPKPDSASVSCDHVSTPSPCPAVSPAVHPNCTCAPLPQAAVRSRAARVRPRDSPYSRANATLLAVCCSGVHTNLILSHPILFAVWFLHSSEGPAVVLLFEFHQQTPAKTIGLATGGGL